MNWVHFVEIKQPVSTSEQNRLVDDWYNRRPVRPVRAEPERKPRDHRLWIGVPTVALGFMLGMCLLLINQYVGILAIFTLPYVAPWVAVKIRRALIKRKRRTADNPYMQSDLAEYKRALYAWRLEERNFFKWWPTNEYVSTVLQKSAKDTRAL